MFCPSCEAEYREGIAECADCEVALVAERPAPPDHSAPDLEEVFRSADPAILPVVQSLLEAEGIEVWVQGADTMAVLPVGQFGVAAWSGSGPGLSVRISVPRAQASEARALIADVEESAGGDAEA